LSEYATPDVESEEGADEETATEPSPSTEGFKTYRFVSSIHDYGEVVPVAEVVTSQGPVARGETIKLSEDEAAALNEGGHTFEEAEEGDGA